MILVPILLTTGILGGLYALRGPLNHVDQGKRYLFGLPRALFTGLTDDQIRAALVADFQQPNAVIAEPQVRSIAPDAVWFTGTWTQPSHDIQQSIAQTYGLRGPYALLVGNY
jgi:hypothetical protein